VTARTHGLMDNATVLSLMPPAYQKPASGTSDLFCMADIFITAGVSGLAKAKAFRHIRVNVASEP
jgi:hypothetical protein